MVLELLIEVNARTLNYKMERTFEERWNMVTEVPRGLHPLVLKASENETPLS